MKAKALFCLFVLVAVLTAAEKEQTKGGMKTIDAPESWLKINEPSSALFTATSTQYLQFQCGAGYIRLDCKTGAVEISPADMPLDKAAIEFWKTVAKAFPEARRQIIEGEKKPPTP